VGTVKVGQGLSEGTSWGCGGVERKVFICACVVSLCMYIGSKCKKLCDKVDLSVVDVYFVCMCLSGCICLWCYELVCTVCCWVQEKW